ncbi:hypothetical protein, partial [Citrobacter freundii]|uniref:hypothetical protein n=2 Tax=Citrobacter freundii complex TaxID=1344959 RepID=UPI001D0340BE
KHPLILQVDTSCALKKDFPGNTIPLNSKWNWSGWLLKKKAVLPHWPGNMTSMITCSLNG